MTKQKRENLILDYLKDIKRANKETPKKERFKDLLKELFGDDEQINQILKKITKGSETTVLNIPRKDKVHRGRADTLYNKIIIEFENSLKISLKHAKEQLAGYLLGQFKSGEGYNFTLIASDCITWKVFSPDISQLSTLETQSEDTLKLNEVTSASFTLNENNADDFYYWLDRFLFKEEKQKATLLRIEEAFGYQSNVFIESFRQMVEHYGEVGNTGEIQVSYEQWSKFLSVAYGTFDASPNNFLVHTYLSIFSKMLAYAVLSNDDFIDDDEMKSILEGTVFHKYNLQNFVDSDFFSWVKADKNFKALKKVFRLIAQEISAFDFHDVDEDVLKGVYQELIDLDTRHALGEYYTPDWLCQRIVSEFKFTTTDKILDPSCGSASFLRSIVHRIKELHPNQSVEKINDQIYGIDIHPLSVQIAKTTLVLALGKDVRKAKKPIHLNIIQANTLLAPEGIKDLFGDSFEMSIDKQKYSLNSQIFEDVQLFDDALEVCEIIAEKTQNKPDETYQSFAKILSKQTGGGISPSLAESFYKIYQGFKHVKEKGRDSIWKFIVQNLYKPYFLNKKFEYVIGNPPWFTYSSVKNEEYQETLFKLAEKHNLIPERKANTPHLEIAAIFLSYCSHYFLKEEGKIAFVLPRSFFSADHHDNTRSGQAKGFALTNAWDLEGVLPLFRIPSCVLFAKKVGHGYPSKVGAKGLPGIDFEGRLPISNCNWEIAKEKLVESDVTWFYNKQGKSSAFATKKTKFVSLVNPYRDKFKQGATIVPRNFYFVELTQEKPDDWEDRILNVKTSDEILTDAKMPWKSMLMSGKMESKYLFMTALAKSLLPFALYKPDIVVLPIEIVEDESGLNIQMVTHKTLYNEGVLNASDWFEKVSNYWDKHKTEKSKAMTANDRIDFQKGITDQNLNAKYIVVYSSSAKDANTTVVERADYDLPFISESKGYSFYTNNKNEAYYLAAVLNSSVPNEKMKAFQTRGLFGARDVHKKILDVYWQKFDKTNEFHLKIAELSIVIHKKVREFLDKNAEDNDLLNLGRLRLKIKDIIKKEMEQLDKLVKKVLQE